MQTNFLVAANAINTSPAKVAKIGAEQSALEAGFRYKTANQLSGATMFAYTVAILSMLGAFKGNAFKAKALAGMFGSMTVINHHKKAGNLETAGAGLVRLTIKGNNHFGGRELGKTANQSIEAKDARCLALAIKAGPTGKVAEESAAVRAIQWRKVGETK